MRRPIKVHTTGTAFQHATALAVVNLNNRCYEILEFLVLGFPPVLKTQTESTSVISYLVARPHWFLAFLLTVP